MSILKKEIQEEEARNLHKWIHKDYRLKNLER